MTSRRLHFTGLLAACVAAAALPSSALAAAPTDPQAALQQPLQLMHVGQALDLIARPLADVPVMVADTGLEWSNPDIAPRLWRTPVDSQVADPDHDRVRDVPAGSIGWDFIGGASRPGETRPDIDPHDPDGQSGHGTTVAGLLGAAWNNGEGGAGVAPNARFLAARTCWDGDQCYEHIVGAAIDWAAGLGVRVVSFSWLSGPLEADSPLRQAIVTHPDVLFVTIPSGNGGAYDADGENPQPCNLDVGNVICVSTSAPDDGLDCGAYGPRSVDVAVPTQGNYTTRNGFTLGGPVSQGPTGCATSFAAPTAAGLATLLFGIDPTARPADVRAAIVDSARRVPAWAGKSVSGGVADAQSAVTLFQQRRGIAPATQTPPPVQQPGGGTLRRGPVIRPGNQDLVRPKVLEFRSMANGRSIRFRLSERARVRIAFYRGVTGRKPHGGRCTPGKRVGRYCVIWTKQGVLAPRTTFAAKAKAINLKTTFLTDPRRRLPAGRIRAQLVATDPAGNRSATFSIAFTLPR